MIEFSEFEGQPAKIRFGASKTLVFEYQKWPVICFVTSHFYSSIISCPMLLTSSTGSNFGLPSRYLCLNHTMCEQCPQICVITRWLMLILHKPHKSKEGLGSIIPAFTVKHQGSPLLMIILLLIFCQILIWVSLRILIDKIHILATEIPILLALTHQFSLLKMRFCLKHQFS